MNTELTEALQKLRGVIDDLLGPEGCPWDKEQTPQSLCDYLLEETFELVDAIRSGKTVDVREELGDVMFLLLFISKLYETNDFTLADSLQENAAKMIRRHPHVFSDAEIHDQQELLANWERIKRSERKEGEEGPKRTFDSLPKGLPPMLKAYRIHSKAARVGFTWDSEADVEKQLLEEWIEFQQACETEDQESMEQEFGDYLFTLIELGRRKGIKGNAALNYTNLKFLKRFACMETMAEKQKTQVADLNFAELDALWNKAKSLT